MAVPQPSQVAIISDQGNHCPVGVHDQQAVLPGSGMFNCGPAAASTGLSLLNGGITTLDGKVEIAGGVRELGGAATLYP